MSERPHDGPLREGSTFLVMAPYGKNWKGGVPEIRHNETVWLNNHGYHAMEVMPRENWFSPSWEEEDSMSLGVSMHTNHDGPTMAEWSMADPLEAWKYFKYLKYDVMDAHEGEQYFSSYIFAGLRKYPWTVDIVCEHADAPLQHLRKFAPAADAYKLLGFGDVAVVNGDEMAAKYKEANGIDYHVIRNPINVSRFSPDVESLKEIGGVDLQDGSTIIGFLGRLEKRKGVDVALRAIALLVNDPGFSANFKFVVAGSGSEEQNLKNLAKELGLGKYVFFVGEIEDNQRPGFYSAADFFLLPSVTDESSGLTVAEAMAAGKLVIGGRAYKVGKLIKHGETGFQMETADPQEAKQYLKLVLGSEEEGVQSVNLLTMGVAGRKEISQFSEDIIFAQRVDLANEVRMWKLDRYHKQRTFFYVPEIPLLHKAIGLVWKNPVSR